MFQRENARPARKSSKLNDALNPLPNFRNFFGKKITLFIAPQFFQHTTLPPSCHAAITYTEREIIGRRRRRAAHREAETWLQP